MLPRPLRAIWGDLSNEEIKKFGILAVTLFSIIGAYWMLRAMKNASFEVLVGYEWQPMAKFVSVFSVVLVVLIYSKLVDWFSAVTLFWILGLTYGLGFIFIGYFINHPDMVTISPTSDICSSFFMDSWPWIWLVYLSVFRKFWLYICGSFLGICGL